MKSEIKEKKTEEKTDQMNIEKKMNCVEMQNAVDGMACKFKPWKNYAVRFQR